MVSTKGNMDIIPDVVVRRPKSKQSIINPRSQNPRNRPSGQNINRRSRCVSTSSVQSQCTIFSLYHPWKDENAEKEIETMPEGKRDIFNATVKGRGEELQELLENPELLIYVHSSDQKGRTPLHLACAFGYFKIVELLLSYGAVPNALDSSRSITPLICAAVIGDERIMSALLAKNVDINFGIDNQNESFINNEGYGYSQERHTALIWAVKAGNECSVKFLLEKGALITSTLMYRVTPLHEAAYFGYDRILKILLHHEQMSNPKLCDLKAGQTKHTALHIAVAQGHENCIEVLLVEGANPNAQNANMQTPLHIAAFTSDFDAMMLLLMYKANPDIEDNMFRTALHYCVIHYNDYESVECMELLLVNGAQVDIQDELGYTPFHLAVVYDYSPLVALLLRFGADLTRRIKSGQSGLEVLVKKMPHAIRYVKESLDMALFLKNKDPADPNCTLALDFRAIVTTGDRKVPKILKFQKETEFLSSLCATGHRSILTHPLIEAFLILKWQKVRKYFYASFVLNLVMVITYSSFLVTVYSSKCPLDKTICSKAEIQSTNGTRICDDLKCVPRVDVDGFLTTYWAVLIIMTSIFLIKEILQMIQSPWEYSKLFENYVQLLFIITVVVTIYPIWYTMSCRAPTSLCCHLDYWAYRFAAIGILVAWFLILFRIGKMPKFGLYVQMLLKVVANFLLFMIAYASILIAFALSFSILFVKQDEFSSLSISLQSVLVMMTGEVDIKYIIPDKNYGYIGENTQALPFVMNFMFAIFVLLVTIVLMNLLVGLAVSDIQGLHKGAKEARLSRLVVAISQLEAILFSKGIVAMLLPKRLKEHLQTRASLVPSDKMHTFFFKPHDPRDTRLPQPLQIEALHIVETRERENARANKQTKVDKTLKHESADLLFEKIKHVERTLESLTSKIDKILTTMGKKSNEQ